MGLDDTIYALSSGGLPSGIGVIRISGDRTRDFLVTLCGRVPAPRTASLLSIRKRNNSLIDQGLVLFFPSPDSFTGEDVAELQLHGGKAVIAAVLDELSSLGGRHADAGEFSRRAFLKGKLDLVEIEGLSDLITAETEMQRRLAVEHSAGNLSVLYESWSRRLTHARAMIEAELDFADEDDVPGSVSEQIWADMTALDEEIQAHIDGAAIAEIIRDGFNVVIAGAPNAGKSSLLNVLAKRDVAIVTEIAGTTRDVLSVDLSLAGFSIKLQDTAGLRETEDMVEKEGIRRARAALSKADLILSLADSPNGFETVDFGNTAILRVGTKIDSCNGLWDKSAADVLISAKTGEGIDALVELIVLQLPKLNPASNLALPTRRRHVDCLREARSAIAASLENKSGLDIQAEYLRIAGEAMGKITGRVDVEDLLSVIFSEFCIGK